MAVGLEEAAVEDHVAVSLRHAAQDQVRAHLALGRGQALHLPRELGDLRGAVMEPCSTLCKMVSQDKKLQPPQRGSGSPPVPACPLRLTGTPSRKSMARRRRVTSPGTGRGTTTRLRRGCRRSAMMPIVVASLSKSNSPSICLASSSTALGRSKDSSNCKGTQRAGRWGDPKHAPDRAPAKGGTHLGEEGRHPPDLL